MMRLSPALLLVACAPKIPPGPVPVDEAAKPVRVVELADDSSPNVYFQAMIHAGSAADPVGKEGLAALVAQSLVDAGSGGRSSTEVRDALYPTGNGFDLVVDREWVSVRLRCHVDHTDLCLELFADALLEPAFDQGDWNRIRDAAEYSVGDGLLADEEALGEEMLNAVLYEGHPYGHPVQGRGGTLGLLQPDDARTFYERRYVRQAMVVGIAGNYDGDTVSAMKQRFEAVPGVPMPEIVLQQPVPVEGRSLAIVGVETGVTGIHFGHPLATDRNHEDWPELMVAMTATGAHRQSFGRLFRILRTARGLNYGTYSYVEQYVQRGWSSWPENGVLRRQNHFYVWIRPTSIENGPFALKLAIAEMERLKADGLEPQEFEDTREYLRGWVPLLAQDPGRRLAFALEAEAAGVPNLLDHLVGSLDAMTVEEVNDAVDRHLNLDDLRIVAVTGDPEDLRDRLLADDPTPIVYRDVTPDEAQAARDDEVAARDVGLDEDDVWIVESEGLFR